MGITYSVDSNGCHVCTSHRARASYGYPAIKVNGRAIKLVRWLWLKKHGSLPPVLRHTCDNPACINLGHILPGTHKDNADDRVSRGRGAIGEKHGRARLDEAKVREILASKESSYALARRLGVAYNTVRNVRIGANWKHVRTSEGRP